MRRICVFCGASAGARPEYRDAARAAGRAIAEAGRTVVYGGGRVGLMGVLADAALEAGGEVIGVIPRALSSSEIAHGGLTELRVVGSMHERKATMERLSDGFLAMPGGFGTLDELFEILTWAQLGLHAKPVCLLNVCGYYDGLLNMLKHAVSERFVRREHLAALLVARCGEEAVRALVAAQPGSPPLGAKRLRP